MSGRRFLFLFAIVQMGLVTQAVWTAPPGATAGPGTVTVNATGDTADANAGDGVCDTGGLNATGQPACTLRAALQEANASAGIDTIEFGIPAADAGHSGGVWTIAPGSALPPITAPVTIDGYTQPGASANTRAVGNDAVLAIEIDGHLTSGVPGLALNSGSSGSTVRGLVVNRFTSALVNVVSSLNTIAGNWLGLKADGVTAATRSGSDGIFVQSASNTIGGTAPADRNVVSGNNHYGVYLFSDAADNNVILGNHIGTTATGTAALANTRGVMIHSSPDNNTVGGTTAAAANVISGNTQGVVFRSAGGINNVVEGNIIGLDASAANAVPNQIGVWIDDAVTDTTIGGTVDGSGNVIAGNAQQGVAMYGSAGVQPQRNSVLGNSIGGNGALGVDLSAVTTGPDGVTANDAGAGDGDAGANGLQNFPVITSAVASGGTVTVGYDLDVAAGTYRVELFTTTAPDPSGYGEGDTFVQAATIIHPGGGSQSFQASFTGSAAGVWVTATATALPTPGDFQATSELSAAFVVDAAPVAVDDPAAATEDGAPVSVSPLANDTDAEGDPLTLGGFTQPAHGSVAASGAVLAYTPDPDWHGVDTFTYTVADGRGGTDTGTVSVTVAPVNDPPVAVADSATTTSGSAVTVAVLTNDTDVDGDTLSLASVSAPPVGSAAANSDDTVTYTAPAGWTGTVTFHYAVTDGALSANGDMTVTVDPAPPPPTTTTTTAPPPTTVPTTAPPPTTVPPTTAPPATGPTTTVPAGVTPAATTTTTAAGPATTTTTTAADPPATSADAPATTASSPSPSTTTRGAGLHKAASPVVVPDRPATVTGTAAPLPPASEPVPAGSAWSSPTEAARRFTVAAARTARAPGYPVASLALMAAFLVLEHLRDRRDPKLMRAPRQERDLALLFPDPPGGGWPPDRAGGPCNPETGSGENP